MNFQELMQRMAELDKPVIEEPNEGNAFSGALDAARDAGEDNFEVDGKTYKVKEDGSFEEACGLPPPGMSDMPGGMMGMRSGTPPQPDSINANVSLNASGKGGIRDLMDLLRNFEGEKHEMPGFGDADADVIVKKMSPPMGLDDDFDNAPDEIYQGVDAVTRTGGDLHSKGIEKPAVAGGGNPMAVESLKKKLQEQYNQIKKKVNDKPQKLNRNNSRIREEKATDYPRHRKVGTKPVTGRIVGKPVGESIGKLIGAAAGGAGLASGANWLKDKFSSDKSDSNERERNKKLQMYLNKEYNAGLQVDGIIGPKTRDAIDEFMEEYTIQKGDTLTKIAKANDTTVDAIMKANPQITDRNKIAAGASLNLPGQNTASAAGQGASPADEEVPAMPDPNRRTGTMAQRDEWLAKYGKTHNQDGTPKAGGQAASPASRSAVPQTQPAAAAPGSASAPVVAQSGEKPSEEPSSTMDPDRPNVDVPILSKGASAPSGWGAGGKARAAQTMAVEGVDHMKLLESFENKRTGSLFFTAWMTFRPGSSHSADSIGAEPLNLSPDWGVDKKTIQSQTMSGSRRGNVILDWVYGGWEGRGTISDSGISFNPRGTSRLVAGSADIPITFSYKGENYSGLFVVFFRGVKSDQKSMREFFMSYLNGLVLRPGVQIGGDTGPSVIYRPVT